MHRIVVVGLALVLLGAGALPVGAARAGAPDPGARLIAYRHWASPAQLAAGVEQGTRIVRGRLRIDRPFRRRALHGTTYDAGRWTSPWTSPGWGFTELVASWEATTPTGTWIQVQVRGADQAGRRSSWDTTARWAAGDATIARTSLGPQRDDLAHVATDTWEANQAAMTSWQLRVTLFRRTGTTGTPRVDTIGAMVSALPATDRVATSTPGVAREITLPVPAYSQMTHAGQYPRYGGGGEAWCSPTSTTMVLGYYHALPARSDYAWVNRSYSDRFVDQGARMTYDHRYGGTGNWPFNTAYAAGQAGHAFVTRFRSLRGVERFVAVGIPVVVSISFGRGGLTGAPIAATPGHLVVVVGFTDTGDVVVNDPAARSDAGVRRVYDRGQFEDAWLPRYTDSSGTHGSGGLAYVIRDSAHPLPARHGNRNW